MGVIGLDVGGANLKLATLEGVARCMPFALWKHPQQLAQALAQLLDGISGSCLAVTMTGELADCYPTKAAGVVHILQCVQEVWSGPMLVYRTDGTWCSPAQAQQEPWQVAASNWHALAQLAQQLSGWSSGMLIDIGSTTTDLIPWHQGEICPVGWDDPGRLASGALVYLGALRTPICALVESLPWQAQQVPVAAEVFATSWDVYLLLGELPPQPERTDTADGRPATVQAAHARVARQICADSTAVSLTEAQAMARWVHGKILHRLAEAFRRLSSRFLPSGHGVVVSGSGEFLAQALLRHLDHSGPVLSLAQRLGPQLSAVAPAFAVAKLATQQL